MEAKKLFDFRLLAIIGSLFIIFSTFIPWVSNITLLELYVLYTSVELVNSFLYLFPLISGIICLVGGLLLIYNSNYRINSIIINFIGLGFLLFFFFDYIPKEIDFLSKAGIGFYFCILGFLLILLYLVNILFMKEKE